MLRNSCSRGPIHSTAPPCLRERTGLVRRQGPRKRKSPGNRWPQSREMHTISMSLGMPPDPETFRVRSLSSARLSFAVSILPRGQPSSMTQQNWPCGYTEGLRLLDGSGVSMPRPASTAPTALVASSGAGLTTALHMCAMWFSRPQGVPSGVCTGHRKPHVSGSSLRTVVVFISVKYCPRWMAAKCELYRAWFSLSATTVYPDFCMRSKPFRELILPVAKKFPIFRSRSAHALIWASNNPGSVLKSSTECFAFPVTSSLRSSLYKRPRNLSIITSMFSFNTIP
mmetsp:Transcript_110306/g.296035  ORF Transcript_110306/g.296035 Transcript_110306/m.296035 type:complete len:283 (-) Transcript_110306:318-1166(-)